MHQIGRALETAISGGGSGPRSMSLDEDSPTSPHAQHVQQTQRAAPAATANRRGQRRQAVTPAEPGTTAIQVGPAGAGHNAAFSKVAMATRSWKRKLEAETERERKLQRGQPASGGLRSDGRDSSGCSGVHARPMAFSQAIQGQQDVREQNGAPREGGLEVSAVSLPGMPKEREEAQYGSGLGRLSSSRSRSLR